LVFEIGGGFNQPGSNSGVGGGPCHFEQRRRCFASVVAVLGHGTGSPIFWRMNAQPKIAFRERKQKNEPTEAGSTTNWRTDGDGVTIATTASSTGPASPLTRSDAVSRHVASSAARIDRDRQRSRSPLAIIHSTSAADNQIEPQENVAGAFGTAS